MPTYEYRCPKGHTFDVFQRMSDTPGAACPECGEAAERQISSGAGFIFKGDGFYITDSRSKDYKEKASKETPGGSPSKAGGEKASGSGSDGSAPAPAKESPSPKSDRGGSSKGSSSGSDA